MTERTEHCAFAVLNKSSGKCIAACHRNSCDEDCIGIKPNGDPHDGHEVALGRNLKLERL